MGYTKVGIYDRPNYRYRLSWTRGRNLGLTLVVGGHDLMSRLRRPIAAFGLREEKYSFAHMKVIRVK